MDEAEFTRFHSSVKRGDIVGVIGFPGLDTTENVSSIISFPIRLTFMLCDFKMNGTVVIIHARLYKYVLSHINECKFLYLSWANFIVIWMNFLLDNYVSP